MVKVIIYGSDKEVVVNKLKDIVDNSPCGNLASVVAIVVNEAVEQVLLEGFIGETSELLKLYLLFS